MNWRRETKLWLQAAGQIVLPVRCPGCGREMDENGAWCEGCLQEVWQPRRLDVRGRGMKHVEACEVLTGYDGTVRQLLHGLKFAGRRGNVAPLAWLLALADAAELGGLNIARALAVPVPLSTERLSARGYNQVELLFADWGKKQRAVWLPDALVRQRPTQPQWELDRTERKDNMKGAFFATRPQKFEHQAVLLLDDIVTTGCTIEECARTLRRAGAASVQALVLAGG